MIPREQTFTIGPFTFSRSQGLLRDGKSVPLRHLERQLLKCLLDRPCEVVRKEEIFSTLWPQTNVSPNTLNVLVHRLRIVLKDSKRPNRYLKSSSRMGFLIEASPVAKRRLTVRKSDLAPGDKSRFIRDITVPDGSLFSPGERFEKVWEIQNVGSVPWRGRVLRRVGAPTGPGRLGSEALSPIPDTEPGEACLVRLWVLSPDQPGSYYAAWKMVDTTGRESLAFQSPLFVSIDVIDDRP